MHTTIDLFDDWEVPTEDWKGSPSKNIARVSKTLERNNMLLTNKGNIKSEDQDKFIVDTIEILNNGNNNSVNIENYDDFNVKYQVYHSRKLSPLKVDLLSTNSKQKIKSRNLSEIRKLIGAKSVRMSSNKVLGILISPHLIN